MRQEMAANRPAPAQAAGSSQAAAQPVLQLAKQQDAAVSTALARSDGNSSSAAVTPRKSTMTVTRGDSLWRISRLTYGEGTRYALVYRANRDRIRNPDRIYPGQVFVLPLRRALTGHRYSPSVTSAQCRIVLLLRNSITLGSIAAGRSWSTTAVATMASQWSLKATASADVGACTARRRHRPGCGPSSMRPRSGGPAPSTEGLSPIRLKSLRRSSSSSSETPVVQLQKPILARI